MVRRVLDFRLFSNPQVQATLYGIDWNAPLGCDDTADAVQVPRTDNPLTPEDYERLCQEVDASSDFGEYGIDQYLATLCFVQARISQY